jgi:autophagy-related protein 5
LPRLLDFFAPSLIVDATEVSPWDGYLTYDDVPLKWHLPVGLLYDIYALSSQSPDSQLPLPFRLILHFSDASSTSPNGSINLIKPEPVVLHDSFINSVKEADFLRSGTAKPIMSLSAVDSKTLWSSTQSNDLKTHSRVYASLLPTQFRNIPMRIYLPSSPNQDPNKAQIKVLQSHVPPFIAPSSPNPAAQRMPTPGQAQTLGTALHTMLPNLFPSRRTPILGRPILHGAVVPMSANLEELARWASYADGWLGIVIVMNS